MIIRGKAQTLLNLMAMSQAKQSDNDNSNVRTSFQNTEPLFSTSQKFYVPDAPHKTVSNDRTLLEHQNKKV